MAATGTPRRFYSFEAKGILMIVLDANNEPDSEAPTKGRDGVQGAYYIDAVRTGCVTRWPPLRRAKES